MKNFQCGCGQKLFFENTRCLNCDSAVGFDPVSFEMFVLDGNDEVVVENRNLGLCRNTVEYGVCNWLVAKPANDYCQSCALNQTIPDLMAPNRRRWWSSLEQAKRRLLYSLLSLGLPVRGKQDSPDGMAFAFIEDRRSNPQVFEEHVNTGHLNGLITINVAEADNVNLEQIRQSVGEEYRTLLGHFRHESGHYYFYRLINNADRTSKFRLLFGDERADYHKALQAFYANDSRGSQQADLISRYAQLHPLEDWAECWAHYLHMIDTLETADFYQLTSSQPLVESGNANLGNWSVFTEALNAVSRSLGLEDAYPFVLSPTTRNKLDFIHSLLCPNC